MQRCSLHAPPILPPTSVPPESPPLMRMSAASQHTCVLVSLLFLTESGSGWTTTQSAKPCA